jgi:membrane fusion protein, multidrug efflux system
MVRAERESEVLTSEARTTGAYTAANAGNSVSPSRRRRVFTSLAIIGVILAVIGMGVWFFMQGKEETDDAYVDGHISNVSSRISGTVSQVLVNDNEPVQAGQVLARLDPNDYDTKLEQSQAALEEAKHQVEAAQSKVEQSLINTEGNNTQANADVTATEAQMDWARAQVLQTDADIKQAEMKVSEQEAQLNFATSDFERYKAVYADKAVTKQQFDKAREACDVARAQLEGARQALHSAMDRRHQMRAQLGEMFGHVKKSHGGITSARAIAQQSQIDKAQLASAQATVKKAEAQLKQSQLDRSYCTILAPVSGRAGRKNCEVGQRVDQGQMLMAVVQDHPWISANYKETQIGHMHPGQEVEIKIDTFGGRTFKGKVDSISPASGARFSMLPPDNATGNFTKVVQRVPVKIIFDEQSVQPFKDLISPGMSCIVTVLTKK